MHLPASPRFLVIIALIGDDGCRLLCQGFANGLDLIVPYLGDDGCRLLCQGFANGLDMLVL